VGGLQGGLESVSHRWCGRLAPPHSSIALAGSMYQNAGLKRSEWGISMKRTWLLRHFMAKRALSPERKGGARAACRGDLGSSVGAGCHARFYVSGDQVSARSVPARAGRSRRVGLMQVQIDANTCSTFAPGFGRASSRPTRSVHRTPPSRSSAVPRLEVSCDGSIRAGWSVGGAGDLQDRYAR